MHGRSIQNQLILTQKVFKHCLGFLFLHDFCTKLGCDGTFNNHVFGHDEWFTLVPDNRGVDGCVNSGIGGCLQGKGIANRNRGKTR